MQVSSGDAALDDVRGGRRCGNPLNHRDSRERACRRRQPWRHSRQGRWAGEGRLDRCLLWKGGGSRLERLDRLDRLALLDERGRRGRYPCRSAWRNMAWSCRRYHSLYGHLPRDGLLQVGTVDGRSPGREELGRMNRMGLNEWGRSESGWNGFCLNQPWLNRLRLRAIDRWRNAWAAGRSEGNRRFSGCEGRWTAGPARIGDVASTHRLPS